MSEPLPSAAGENRILAALPVNEGARLIDDLERVTLPLGHVLYEPGDVLGFVYFPTSCIVSLVFTTENGATAELAMTGKDGLVGIPLVLGGRTSTHKAVVQCAGTAWRLRAEVMAWELNQHGHLLRLALCYTQALMTQIAQSVVCNRHHAVDQQLCRWLLLSLDQLPDNQLNMTQELIANMLGVRREAVTEAAGKLQAAGLIQYRRGQITVTDRPGLEARVCECYGVVRAEYERLFHLPQVILPSDRARPNPATLRKRAEARLEKEKADRAAASSAALNADSKADSDTAWQQARLVHELEVHQIELEMSNEALRLAYDEADALHRKYADIYDFAPIPYFTLDAQGVIVQFNLAGAILLDIQRSQTRPHRFAAFVKPESLPVFNDFLEEKLRGRCRRSCELVLLATAHHPELYVRIQAVTDEGGNECQMAVLDATAGEHSADHDRRRNDPELPPVDDPSARELM
jgi:CRP-like cAMP-binding protein